MELLYIYSVLASKIKFLCLLFAFIFCNNIQAQFYPGIKGSYAIPFIRTQEIKYDDAFDFLVYKVRFIEQDVSPTISLFGYYRNDKIYLQGELAYRRVKSRFASFDYLKENDPIPIMETKETNYLMVPLSAGVRFQNFKFGCGPVISFILSENKLFEELLYFEEKRRKMEYGFSFSAGLALYRLHIDISYQLQFEGVGDYIYFREDSKGFTNQPQFVNLGLGFLF